MEALDGEEESVEDDGEEEEPGEDDGDEVEDWPKVIGVDCKAGEDEGGKDGEEDGMAIGGMGGKDSARVP